MAGGSASPKTQDLSGGRTALFANALRTTRSTSSINYQLFPNPFNLRNPWFSLFYLVLIRGNLSAVADSSLNFRRGDFFALIAEIWEYGFA
jgi:hypothetical protein